METERREEQRQGERQKGTKREGKLIAAAGVSIVVLAMAKDIECS